MVLLLAGAMASGAAMALAGAVTAGAQTAAARPEARQPVAPRQAAPPDSLVVSFLSVGPGKDVFDRFGHAAIRLHDAATGLDSAWNWGMYDFDSPGFIWRFLTGETHYWMAGYPTELVLDYYRRANRAVWEQELALNRAQADSLLAFLRWNALPANRFYRYDYYLDNCATRVRDVIDAITHGSVRRATEAVGGGVTWRSETLRLGAAFPLLDFGMTFALGPRADATLSAWQEGFIPMRLRDALRGVRLAPDGRPLVANERTLVPVSAFPEATAPPSYAGAAGMIGLGLAVVIIGLARAAASRAARIALGTIGTLWHLVAGLAGTLVLAAGLFTRHQFMGANASVLLGTPASLALVLCFARAWSPAAGPLVRRAAAALSVLAAVAALFAAAAHMMGPLSPADWAPVALAAPVHLALAIALTLHERGLRTPAARGAERIAGMA